MKNLTWLKKNFGKNQGKYREVVCPFLVNNICSIYERRFNCCRNFPRKGNFYCSDSDCKILKKGIRKNTKKGTDNCIACRDNCCSQILVPKDVKVTKRFISRLMNVSCQECKVFFKK